MKRAFHYLLRGDFAKALYYNWLVYPAIAGAATIVAVNVLELTTGRNLFAKIPPIRLTRTSLSAMAVCLVLLWCLQVYLAVSQHKTELLNPNGLLYSLVVH